jgi:hypothetical protein
MWLRTNGAYVYKPWGGPGGTASGVIKQTTSDTQNRQALSFSLFAPEPCSLPCPTLHAASLIVKGARRGPGLDTDAPDLSRRGASDRVAPEGTRSTRERLDPTGSLPVLVR